MFIPDISQIEDGVTTIVITPKDSELTASINKNLEKNTLDASLYLVDPADSDSTLFKTLQTMDQISKDLAKDCLVFISKNGNTLTYISHRPQPEPKYDWLDVAKAFGEQYNNKEADDSGYWRWGQLVQEDGEYLCLDCGYIEDLKAGAIFPVCEVCLAGDPGGPLAIRDGFWEKI
jgi:hypothetical protein